MCQYLLGAVRAGLPADKVQETEDPRLHSMSGKVMVLPAASALPAYAVNKNCESWEIAVK